MPTTIFERMVRTAMLAMAGLVTLSILGSIAAMTNDPGTGSAGGERPILEAERPAERETAPAPPRPEAGNQAAAAPADAQGGAVAAVRPAGDGEDARWLEAIAYALLAVAGVGALAVLMLWSIVRELRRIGAPPPR
ncbi:MAG TPA: hypothetical protein VF718_12410 [Allosphingosinicella sp.]|jgi:hypothetical protein